MTRAPRTKPKADPPPEPVVEVVVEPATPGHQAVDELRRSVEAARIAAEHATAAVELGRRALPEVADIARTALDDQVEQMKVRGQEAAEVAVDQMELARELIIDQVKQRPITSALAAVGAGFMLGVLFYGRRR